MTPRGNLVAGGGDRFVTLFDVEAGELLSQLQGHTAPIVDLAFSPDGSLLASASDDGSIRVWVAERGEMVHVLRNRTLPRNPHPPRCIAFAPDGTTLVGTYLLHRDQTQIVIYSLERGEWDYVASQPRPEAPVSLAYSPDSRTLAIAKDSGNVTLMEVVEFGVRERWTPPRVVLNRSSGFPRGLDSTRYPVKHQDGRSVSHVAFSHDSIKLLSCGRDNTIRIWEQESGEERLVLSGSDETRCLLAAEFLAHGRRIVSVTDDGVIQLWDTESGVSLASSRGSGTGVLDLALSRGGGVLATCGSQGLVNTWQIADPLTEREQ